MFAFTRRLIMERRSVNVLATTAHAHDRQAIRARLEEPPARTYVADAIYGGFDGTVTTFAVVAGVAGASLSPTITLILGLANLIADGFSMAAGAYLSSRAEEQRYAALREFEQRSIDDAPDGERLEVAEILAKMGIRGAALDAATRTITADRKAWIDLMMLGEYGLTEQRRKSHAAAAMTFGAFVVFGSVPLIPYAAGFPSPFMFASTMTAVSFVALGILKARHAGRNMATSILETLVVGAGAAGLAFAVGHLLAGLA